MCFSEGGGGAEAVDPYDLLDPVNILPLLPKDFYDKVVSSKLTVHEIIFQIVYG